MTIVVWRWFHRYLPLELNGCEIIYQDCQDTQHKTWWWILFKILFWMCRQFRSGQPTTVRDEGIKVSRSDFLKPKCSTTCCRVRLHSRHRTRRLVVYSPTSGFSSNPFFVDWFSGNNGSLFRGIFRASRIFRASGIACRSKGTASPRHDRRIPNKLVGWR